MTIQAEFQAIVLAAGKGSRMPEVTSGEPKCLLPVGPKPLIWYPLHKLQLSGFSECIVIVLENQKNEIQTALDKCGFQIKIDYHSIPSNEDLGTADSLRLISDKIHSDLLIIPCDLVTNVNLNEAVNMFRRHNASITSLFIQPQSYGSLLIPGPKSKHKPERDIVGIDVQTNRLIFLASASDFENEISLPRALLKKHSNIKIYSTLIDSHVFIMKNWVLKYLKNENNISTIKGEFLPHIIKKQLAKPPQCSEKNPSIIQPPHNEDIFSFAKEDDLLLLIRQMSSANDHDGDSKPIYHNDSIRCYACIAGNETFGVRVNTLPSYCFINEKIVEKWNEIIPNEDLVPINSKSEIKSTQVDDKCLVWEGAKLNEKTSFKNSVIGPNVEVNSFSRVFNCVLMKNVVVKEKVALENCIVCEGAVIGSGAQLKSCLIGSHHNVPEQSQHSNEVLTDSDRLMEF